MIDAPCYIKIRKNKNVIRAAYFAMMDGSFEEEIATISAVLVTEFPELFEQWKALLTEANKKTIEMILGKGSVIGSRERKPPENN